jgi:3-methyl-2-oxobutanoate hydroxymethyltransferase
MISAADFSQFKQKPMVVITAYDAPFAARAEIAGVDAILVGDSAANTVLGYASTREVGMEAMLILTGAVARGARNTHIIGDMPYGSDESVDAALDNARRFIAAGAHSVKMEGAKVEIARALVGAGIPVVGHLGLLPQTAQNFKQVARDDQEKARLLEEALSLETAGICALVLEHIPSDLGEKVTRRLSIPTIGIGAGPKTDGQVMVMHDVLGLSSRRLPPFAKAFAAVGQEIEAGLTRYAEAVRGRQFPST